MHPKQRSGNQVQASLFVRLGWLQLVVATLFFGWSLLAVFEAPIHFLWKPAIAATEWGHTLALVALLTLLMPGWDSLQRRAAAVLALIATVIFLSPLFRAQTVARDLPERVTLAFGEADPRAFGGAAPRPTPLVLGDLLSLGSNPGVTLSQHEYRQVEGEQRLADLWLRESPQPQPVVIVIHGGSWSSGDQTQLPAINQYLAGRGFAVVAITYSLAPRFRFPAALEDVFAALDWVKRLGPSLGLDPTRIVLMGRSSGAHLALLAAYRAVDPSLKGVIAYYPPTDLVWSYEHPSNPRVFDSIGALTDFLGGTPRQLPELYHAASPLEFIDEFSPPTLLMHGGRDELVSQRQSQRLQKRLDENGIANLFLDLPWATHGFDANPSGPSGQLCTFAIERFIAVVCAPGP